MFDEFIVQKTVRVSDWEEAVRILADAMYRRGLVRDTYADAVVAREKVFPTGLVTSSVGVAIPHADTAHVAKSAIAVGILDEPVGFGLMGGQPDETVDAAVVFLLAVTRPEDQVPNLQNLMDLFQDQKTLQTFLSADSVEQAEQVLRSRINAQSSGE